MITLIEPSITTTSVAMVTIDTRPIWKQVLGIGDKKPENRAIFTPGKTSYTNCVIDFDGEEISIDTKRNFVFGDKEYLGVFPIRCVQGDQWECCVDMVRSIKEGAR